MLSSSAVTVNKRTDDGEPFSWFRLAAVVFLASLLRIVFAPGFFGSDENVYLDVALQIANGDWPISNYIGALRYGINLPNALFMRLFGVSEYSAMLWSMLGSVGEVALVYVFSHRLWGNRAALLSAIVIALLPLHVVSGARMLGDAPLAFFITLSFLIFWIAGQRQSAAWYFGAGLAVGAVFWVKEVVAIFSAVFFVYALAYREWNFKWLWLWPGAMVMVAANCLLMWAIAGDPFHVFNVVRTVTGNYVHVFKVETSPWYYLGYLFVDIKHNWLMPYLALAGIVLWLAQARGYRALDKSTGYVVLWALGLFSVFSFTPLSFTPLTYIAKQSNYMLIFMAPLCMLAGYALANLSGAWLWAVAMLVFLPSAMLAGLEQGDIRAFTANSKALDRAMQTYPKALWVGSAHNQSLGSILASIDGRPNQWENFRDTLVDPDAYRRRATQAGEVLAVLDPQTLGWKSGPRQITAAQACWLLQGEVWPVQLGIGNKLAGVLASAVSMVPLAPARQAGVMLGGLANPLPARVYRVQGLDVWCGER